MMFYGDERLYAPTFTCYMKLWQLTSNLCCLSHYDCVNISIIFLSSRSALRLRTTVFPSFPFYIDESVEKRHEQKVQKTKPTATAQTHTHNLHSQICKRFFFFLWNIHSYLDYASSYFCNSQFDDRCVNIWKSISIDLKAKIWFKPFELWSAIAPIIICRERKVLKQTTDEIWRVTFAHLKLKYSNEIGWIVINFFSLYRQHIVIVVAVVCKFFFFFFLFFDSFKFKIRMIWCNGIKISKNKLDNLLTFNPSNIYQTIDILHSPHKTPLLFSYFLFFQILCQLEMKTEKKRIKINGAAEQLTSDR